MQKQQQVKQKMLLCKQQQKMLLCKQQQKMLLCKQQQNKELFILQQTADRFCVHVCEPSMLQCVDGDTSRLDCCF
jgi:hypothetical protein